MSHTLASLNVVSGSAEETLSIGRIIGESLNAGDIVALTGELGAGKTCLAKGIAIGLGVSENHSITSPTFTLINEYRGNVLLYHFDLYRLIGLHDMEDLGYEEYLYGDGVCVIEWAEKIRDCFSDEVISIELTYLDENRRSISVSGEGGRISDISNALKNGGI
jgi:tRNA threonylcarbamoyladenosine biosynthesis protein TsaE